MTTFEVLKRKAGTAALVGFRMLPGPIRRTLVRAGTPNYTVGAVCAIEHQGAVLMLSQPHRKGWSLPGGLVDHGETPAEAVAREVWEEIGLRIDPGEPVAFGVYSATQSVDVIFRVQVSERPALSLAAEARRCRWWEVGEKPGVDRETRQIRDLLNTTQTEPRAGRVLS